MPVFELKDSLTFPPPHLADASGLLAYGGDLSPERLIMAYENGIFPWFTENQPVLWWSPGKRMVMYPGRMKVSKSLGRKIRSGVFTVRCDTAFREVITACAAVPRKDQDGTWITGEMINAYCRLHEMGYAHSFECWTNGQLVGGLYGISLGRAFFGESMFTKVTDASKVAFYHLYAFAQKHHFHFIDCQLYTTHLASLGALEIPRSQYLAELKQALAYPDINQPWNDLL